MRETEQGLPGRQEGIQAIVHSQTPRGRGEAQETGHVHDATHSGEIK